ncbi:MAG TPA: hypothetical protein DEB39_01145 [Planctomycetaceae bacterium]|nr:hypothetical protein [Planctomycetaceae bacterium]
MKPIMKHCLLAFLLLMLFAGSVSAQHRIGQLCRIKGQEATMIRGFGIVAGLNGTGDNPREFGPLARGMIQQLQNSGFPMVGLKPSSPQDRGGPDPMRELGTSKNLAFVEVMVTIPAMGARSGDMLDVTVASVNKASSLEFGVLMISTLMDPVPQNPGQAKTLGRAWGKITLDNDKAKNVGTIKAGADGGCRLTSDYIHPFVKENCITLVLDEKYAGSAWAAAIAQLINTDNVSDGYEIAKATSPQNVVVKLPNAYLGDPVKFIGLLEGLEIQPDAYGLEILPRIVIHERSGVIGGMENVNIAPVFLSHQNISIEVQNPPAAPPQRWIPMDVDGAMADPPVVAPKLRALCDTLNAVKVPPKDMIAVIKNLHNLGAIQAQVVYK